MDSAYYPNYYPTPDSFPVSAPVETSVTPEVTGSNNTTFNIFKVIIIVILVILIGVTIALAFVFRNNLNSFYSNENPACPLLNCPVGDPTHPDIISDSTCGASAFRFNGTKKICSNTRYAT